MIRDEGLEVLDQKSGGFIPEEENLRQQGDWKQFTLYQRGRKNTAACRRTPRTCAIVDSIADAASCKRGQVTDEPEISYVTQVLLFYHVSWKVKHKKFGLYKTS